MEIEYDSLPLMGSLEMVGLLKTRTLAEWLQLHPAPQINTIDQQKSLYEGCVQMQESKLNKIAVTC